MRFDSEAYLKLYPREVETPVIESAVPTFKPTEQFEESTPVTEKEDDNNGLDNSCESVCE